MSDTCPGCGKPLGATAMRCDRCELDGEVVDVDDAVRERVERCFIISATKCPGCNGLHTTVTVDGTSYTADDFGIASLADWEREVDRELRWLRAHRRAVEPVLSRLEARWPKSVAAVRDQVFLG